MTSPSRVRIEIFTCLKSGAACGTCLLKRRQARTIAVFLCVYLYSALCWCRCHGNELSRCVARMSSELKGGLKINTLSHTPSFTKATCVRCLIDAHIQTSQGDSHICVFTQRRARLGLLLYQANWFSKAGNNFLGRPYWIWSA
jgi:predicted DNA-binding protein